VNAVADASPLIVLAKIGYFENLTKLYETIYISPEVYHEVVVSGAGLPGASLVKDANWIRVNPLRDQTVLHRLRRETGLDIGELSTIALAKEIGIEIILMDETAGRNLAQQIGLRARGAIGVLEALFRRGELSDLRGAFDSLLSGGAYVDRAFLNRRLQLLGLQTI
jgi:predicted nucleic acid-binding protein